MADEYVILVDEDDREIGTAEKLDAHILGKRHRAVSVFVFDGRGHVLLQRRAAGKYHSAGLWSNTCCGHPRPGETASLAAHRRLHAEMGFECELSPAFVFSYQASVGSGLVENEVDVVLTGRYDGIPEPAPAEVSEWRWASVESIQAQRRDAPDTFTSWFFLAFDRLLEWQARKR